MKKLVLLCLLYVFVGNVYGQRMVEHSDSAFKVGPSPEFADRQFKNQIRLWLDTTFVPILDSLHLKVKGLPGESSRVKIFAFNNNKVMPIKMFDNVEYGGATVNIRNDSLEVFVSVSFPNMRFINMLMTSPIPVNKLTISSAQLYNFDSKEEWFSLNRKDRFSREVDIKIKDWELKFDTFPGYIDTIPSYPERFDINGSITFTTEPIYYHKKLKQRKGEPCSIRVRIYFKTRRAILNDKYTWDDDGNIIRINKN
ncbi:MAG: hypothetical protein M0D57_15150 [Sphingobacteriales bacterium JAD_PAG50586_3]|nr:MAG: hypothetical protein M0D57_15150 [Sphingobacteriales bacterium JAD_PAG50586_3]